MEALAGLLAPAGHRMAGVYASGLHDLHEEGAGALIAAQGLPGQPGQDEPILAPLGCFAPVQEALPEGRVGVGVLLQCHITENPCVDQSISCVRRSIDSLVHKL